jgi:nucleotide-binding universal stress UspA family protein
MLRQMLVPVDFSACARQVAQYAFDLARAIGGQVTLLHVLEDQAPEEARALLRQLGALARLPPECLVVPAIGAFPAGVAAAILEVAAQRGADLIVLGVRGPAQRSPLGQVAVGVLLGALIPVQVVPCAQVARAGRGWREVLAQEARTPAAQTSATQTPAAQTPVTQTSATQTRQAHPELAPGTAP